MKFRFSTLALALALAACQKTEKAPEAPQSETAVAGATAPTSLISELANDPQYGWLAVMRDLFPEEFEQVSQELQQQGSLDAGPSAAKLSMLSILKPFMDAHRKAARNASDAELVAYLRSNTVAAEALLESDAKACTDVFQGHLDPATTLPDATWKKMSDVTAQLLRTAQSAEESPKTRVDISLKPEDIQAWREGMEAIGAGQNTFAILSNPDRKAAATLLEQCQVRVHMLKGALQLPDPLAAKITLHVLQ